MNLTAVSFFINLLLWLVGSSGILLAGLLTVRHHHPMIRQYMVTLGLWSLNLCQLSVFVYLNEMAGIQNDLVNTLLNDIGYFAIGLFVYAMARMLYQFFRLGFSRRIRSIYITVAVVVAFPLITPTRYIASLEPMAALESVKVLALYGSLYFMAFLFRSQIAKVDNEEFRRLLRRVFWLQMIFYPLMMAEGAFFYDRIYPFVFSPAAVFFFWINLLWLSYVSRYLHLPELRILDTADSMDVFAKLYSVTRRERDVAEMLLEGQSYKEIAEALFISPETVKTHVNNLYRKAGVQSKMALSHLIQRCDTDQ